METELLSAQTTLQGTVDLAAMDYEPRDDNSSLTYRYKTITVRAAVRTVEKAMKATAGVSFFQGLGLERCFRDMQAVRYHPFQERRGYVFSGRVAFGLNLLEE